MAVINIRVEDHVHATLRRDAEEEGVSLSEYVRSLLQEAVSPLPVLAELEEGRHGDQPAPTSLSFMERKTLSMLHRILGHVLPENANGPEGDRAYQLDRAAVLEQGFAGEYWMEAAGFSTELSSRDSRRVIEILDMFRILTYSLKQHADAGSDVDDYGLTYQGFDFNDPLEGHMADYVEYLVAHERWSELRQTIAENDNGNSHSPELEVYSRMLAEYRRIMDSRDRHNRRRDEFLLSKDELKSISQARIHPSRRGLD